MSEAGQQVRLPRFARWAGVTVIGIGALALLGWWLDLAMLRGGFPGSAPMVPNTAIGFGLAGLALGLVAVEPVPVWARRLGLLLGGLVALLGWLTLAEYLFGWNPGLDRFAFGSSLERARPPIIGRPSVLSAVSFSLLGLGLLLLDSPSKRVRLLVEGLAVVPVQIALLALIGYACGVPSFYGWKSLYPDTAMSWLTAMSFVVLGGGLLVARPGRGLMQVVIGNTSGSLVARRLLLAPIVIPLVTGLVGIALRRMNVFNAEFVHWSFSFLNIFFFSAVIWWVGVLLHGADGVRRRAEAQLREVNEQLEHRVRERTQELAEALDTLRRSERRCRALIEHGTDGVALINADNRITYLSPAVTNIEGYTPEELLGRSGLEHTHPDDLPVVHDAVQRLLANPGRPLPVLWRRHHKDGRWLWLEGVATNLLADPAVAAIVTNYRDVTERRAASERAAWLATFPERNPNPIVELSPENGAVHYVNPAAARLFPELPEQGARHGLLAGLESAAVPLASAEAPVRHREVGVGGRTFTQTITFIAESRRLRVYSTDITERKRAEEEVRASETRYRTLFDTLIEGFCTIEMIFDADGRPLDYRFLEINPAFERQTGLRNAQGRRMRELVPDHEAHWFEIYGKVALTGEPVQFESEARALGRHYDVCAYRIGGSGSRKVAILFNDITARKDNERKALAQLARLHLLHQITRAIGERQDLPSIFQVVIRSLEDNLPIDFSCVCLHDPVANDLKVVHVGIQSAPTAMELAMVEQSVIPIDENGLSRCVRGQLVYEPDIGEVQFAFPQRLARGGLRSLVIAPLLVESQVFGVLVAARRTAHSFSSGECEFLRQLSEHVALAAHQARLHTALQQAYDDLRRSQQTALQQERLRALGQMASGIAHDINNALSPVALYTESLLQNEPGLSARAREQLQITARAIDDVAATVARMREFYRPRDLEAPLVPTQFSRLVAQVLDLTRARWSDMALGRGLTIAVKSELAPDLPLILGVENELREALTNLVFNAVDAMPAGGTMTLRTRVVSGPGGDRRIEVEVGDSGVGMDEETRRRCLEPFYTTKGERGTGLGLAMVYGTAQRHGAEVEIESAPGQGTTVRLVFPERNAAAGGPDREGDPARVLRRLRLLVVDDDPLLLKSLQDTLEGDGHVVTTAHGGQEGIDEFRARQRDGTPFAAVITDLGMPYVDGRRVAAAIKESSPATPVILLTGWGQRLVAEGDIPAHVDQVLSKPPKLLLLREALARCCPQAVS